MIFERTKNVTTEYVSVASYQSTTDLYLCVANVTVISTLGAFVNMSIVNTSVIDCYSSTTTTGTVMVRLMFGRYDIKICINNLLLILNVETLIL